LIDKRETEVLAATAVTEFQVYIINPKNNLKKIGTADAAQKLAEFFTQ